MDYYDSHMGDVICNFIALGIVEGVKVLFEEGIDVNVLSTEGYCALYYAILFGNIEIVSMCLYYNADVLLKFINGHTPFSFAMSNRQYEIASLLYNYYDFTNDDVNLIIDNFDAWLAFLTNASFEEFQTVLPKMDKDFLLSMRPSFFEVYLKSCTYVKSEWVKSIYFILELDIAQDLFESYRIEKHMCAAYHYREETFLYELLDVMQEKQIEAIERIKIIYTVLSLGVEVHLNDINRSLILYGFTDEHKVLEYHYLSTGNYNVRYPLSLMSPLQPFTVNMEIDDYNEAFELFTTNLMIWYDNKRMMRITLNAISYFSFRANQKSHLLQLCEDKKDYCDIIAQRLQNVPTFPSLQELTRNKIREVFIGRYQFKHPYQFEDFLTKLQITKKSKDIILYKAPIYV